MIIPSFRDVSKDIINADIDRAILKGGRSSTKSQVAADSIVIGCMTNKASAVCLVKYGNKIEERLVNTFQFAIQSLGVSRWWKLRKSPFEYVLLNKSGKETDVSIKFTGCDNADMLKSYKARGGKPFRYVWFEEATNFSGIKEINNIVQTMARGTGKHCVILSYNPPMSTSNWVNKEFDAPCGKVLGYNSNSYEEEIEFELDGVMCKSRQVVHHSTYLDVIDAGHKDWLGLTFIGQAESSKLNNKKMYDWAYLGKVVGTDANVFGNISDWDGTGTENLRTLSRGLDCSNGGSDPWAYSTVAYDKINNDLYIMDEFILGGGASIEDVAINIRKYNKYNMGVYIDSAVPTFRKLLMKEGLNIIPAKKGRDSVEAGILWLKSLNHIYINKVTCPNCYREFKNYEYIMDEDDNVTSELPDKDNHFIDSLRYALCMSIKYSW